MLTELRLPTIARLWPEFTQRSDKEGWPSVTDRRNRAGDDRHNEASWNGPETRFRRVSRMRFFAGFCNGNFALESMIGTERDRAFRFIVTGHSGRT
jgi:hypothetical protein